MKWPGWVVTIGITVLIVGLLVLGLVIEARA